MIAVVRRLVIVGAVFTPLYIVQFPLNHINLAAICFILAAILVLSTLALSVEQKIQYDSVVLSFMASGILIAAGLLLSGIFVGSFMATGLVVGQYLFALVVLPILIWQCGAQSLNRARIAFLIVVLGTSTLGIFEYHGLQLIEPGFLSGNRRLEGWMGNANAFGKMLALSLPLLWISLPHRRFLWLPMVGTFIIFIALIYTSSIGSLIAASVGLLGLLVLSTTKRRHILTGLVIMGLAAIIVLATIGLPDIFHRRILDPLISGEPNSLGSSEVRVAQMSMAIENLGQNPIIGEGAHQFRDSVGMTIHNSYLLIWVEGGILAFTGWLLFSLMLVLSGAVLYWSKKAAGTPTALVSALIWIVAAMFHGHMYSLFWYLPVFLCLALAYRQPQSR